MRVSRVQHKVAVALHDQTSTASLVGQAFVSKETVAARERSIAKVNGCSGGGGELINMQRALQPAVGIEVCARPGVLSRIRAEDFSGLACGHERYGHVVAVNVSDAEIAELQEFFAEGDAVRRQLALEGVELAEAAARAGAVVDGAVAAPYVCRKERVNMGREARGMRVDQRVLPAV